MTRRLNHIFKHLVAATLVAAVIAFVPLPFWTPRWLAYVQVPVVVFLLICYMGKTVLDTFFYNRYS